MNPELLLFLARRMGLWVPGIQDGNVVYAAPQPDNPVPVFQPHTDRAQFADVVIWAAMNGIEITMRDDKSEVWYWDGASEQRAAVWGESTPSGIMAATVEAIARAAGWEE